MASVIVNVLKKRKRGGSDRSMQTAGGINPAETAAKIMRQESIYKNNSGNGMSSSKGKLSKEERAARTVQRTFRGHLLRQQLKGLVDEKHITIHSLTEALEIIAKWHLGWSRFILQLIVAAFLIVTIYFQTFYYTPAAFDVNSAIVQRVGQLQSEIGHITEPLEVPPFVQNVLPFFYQTEFLQTDFCKSVLGQYCALDTNTNDTWYETVLATNCSQTYDADGSYTLDYEDNTDRLLGASFLTQTRKQTRPCSLKVLSTDSTLVKRQRSSKLCLDEQQEATTFQVDCTAQSSSQDPNQTNKANCNSAFTKLDEFQYRPSEGYFLFPLHAGDVQGLPNKAIQCKINRMRRLGWLDYRTKEVCLVLGFFNKQDQGRLVNYRECFRFTNGGRVNNYRVVASTSLFADPTVALVFTWILIGLICGKQLFDLIILLQERRAVRKGRQREWRLKHLTVRGAFGILPSLLILAACIIFLILVFVILSTRDMAAQAGSLDGFVQTLSQANWAVSMWMAYTTTISIALLIMLGKTLLLLDFHPTSAIVSGTLRKASGGLGCFFLIFLIVILTYAYVGMILLGRTRYEFSNYGLAVNTLLFAAIGEVQFLQTSIFYTKVDDEYIVVIQALYFWSYILLMTILLMNVLLSIIVGAFVDLQEKSEKSLESKPILSFTRSFTTSLRFWFGGFRVYAKHGQIWAAYHYRLCRRDHPNCCVCPAPSFGAGCCCVKRKTNPDDEQNEREEGATDSDAPREGRCRRCCCRTAGREEEAPPVLKRQGKQKSLRAPSYPLTPWQRLLAFPKQYLLLTDAHHGKHSGNGGMISTVVARKRLQKVFNNEQTVEHIIIWCRGKTKLEKMQPFGYHLQGLDPDSEALKGRTVFLLESIMKRMNETGSQRPLLSVRTPSSKSVASNGSSTAGDFHSMSYNGEKEMSAKELYARHAPAFFPATVEEEPEGEEEAEEETEEVKGHHHHHHLHHGSDH